MRQIEVSGSLRPKFTITESPVTLSQIYMHQKTNNYGGEQGMPGGKMYTTEELAEIFEGSIFTLEEAAMFFKTSTATIKKLLKERELGGFKFGGEWRFRYNDLMEAEERFRKETAEQQAAEKSPPAKKRGRPARKELPEPIEM